ncbi:hypothetical protein Avbf_18352 [Armadillidium vulgare]|nr:hypothetical protein Avbf_18352 [Armadillidium vulgare]
MKGVKFPYMGINYSFHDGVSPLIVQLIFFHDNIIIILVLIISLVGESDFGDSMNNSTAIILYLCSKLINLLHFGFSTFR